MNTFDSARRDLLKLGSMGLAASAAAALPAFAAAQKHRCGRSATPCSSTSAPSEPPATQDGRLARHQQGHRGGRGRWRRHSCLPRGNYVSFSIRLKSHVGLYLSQGSAIIAGSLRFPTRPPATWAEPTTPPSPTPPGRLPGLRPQPLAQLADLGREHQRRLHRRAGAYLGQGAQLRGRPRGSRRLSIYRAEQPGAGNKAIALKSCRNVILATSRFSRAAIWPAAHGRRQSHHRQSQDRHRPRRHGHRLL